MNFNHGNARPLNLVETKVRLPAPVNQNIDQKTATDQGNENEDCQCHDKKKLLPLAFARCEAAIRIS